MTTSFLIELTGEETPATKEGEKEEASRPSSDRFTRMKLTFTPNSGSPVLPADQVAGIRLSGPGTVRRPRPAADW